eukprot:m.707758 g.707758  ORF g.707758 m.707758 type:complete len:973 (+) comp22936_c1_seq3:138-3056(+)
MPQVKSYRRYAAATDGCLGVIASGPGVAFVSRTDVASATLSTVKIVQIRTGETVAECGDPCSTDAVSALVALAPALQDNGEDGPAIPKAHASGIALAAGYHDGAVRLWSHNAAEIVCFRGHRSAVSALAFLEDGALLASGANDTDVIVWDVVAETGIVRLHGHSGPVTAIAHLPQHKLLVTGSKDHQVKLWDIAGQYCVQTIVGHSNEVCSLVLSTYGGHTRLITGSTDRELRVWAVLDESTASEDDKSQSQCANGVPVVFLPLGSVQRKSTERVVSLQLSPTRPDVLVCQSADKALDVYRFRDAKEITKRLKRRAKRAKEKAAATDGAQEDIVHQELEDEIVHAGLVRVSGKIRSFAFDPYFSDRTNKLRLGVALSNNSIETHVVEVAPKVFSYDKNTELSFAGHRTPLRAVTLSDDDKFVCTTSNKGAKIWDRGTKQCIRSLEAGYGLCVMFVPGNRHVIIGTRSGELQLFDVASGKLLETIDDAHDGAIWSMDLQPDKHGFVTGGADHSVNLWEFELIPDEHNNFVSKRLSCVHVKTLKMTDDVMCVRFSPDQRFLAIALLDATVKVFFADSLKFFVSLYGHKLPVLAMDISRDNTLIATGSGDKNIKIWGLDFGDCHKSFFAHQDVITGVKFLGTSHYLLSTSKDKTVKMWDGDKFEYILTLEGHHAEISGLAVSATGGFVVSVSHDRSIRFWERSNELINLEEERELEREQQQEQEDIASEAAAARARAMQDGDEADRAGKRNIETMKAADKLIEAIELVEIEESKAPGDAPNPLLIAYGNISPEDYLERTIGKIPSSELDESLLVLPFSYAMKLLPYLDKWIKGGAAVERSTRCVLFLMTVHHNQIVSNEKMVPVLQSLRTNTLPQITQLKDTIGFNMAGLRFLQQQINEAGMSAPCMTNRRVEVHRFWAPKLLRGRSACVPQKRHAGWVSCFSARVWCSLQEFARLMMQRRWQLDAMLLRLRSDV